MSRLSQFFLGVRKLREGFGFLMRHPALWLWVALPWLIAILVLVGIWALFFNHFSDFYEFLFRQMGLAELTRGGGFLAALLYGGLWILKQVVKVFLFLVSLILISFAGFIVYSIAAAPFLDLLAEKVGALSKNAEPPPFSFRRLFKGIQQSLGVELKKAALFLAIPILLWVLNFIPAVGNFLYLAFVCFFGMWALGMSCVDYPMGHQLLPFTERLRFCRRHKFALAGFGLSFLIPFAPLLFQAPMVVGGTLLYLDLKSTPEILK